MDYVESVLCLFCFIVAGVLPTTNLSYFVLPLAILNNAIDRRTLLTGSLKSQSRAIHINIPVWHHQAVSKFENLKSSTPPLTLLQAFGFAVGSNAPSNSDTELLQISDWTWSTRAKYPFANDLSYYATAMFNDMFYVFGGRSHINRYTDLSTIAKYNPDSDKWLKVGQLKQPRTYHSVILSKNSFMIIGDGLNNKMTEKCQLDGDLLTCEEQQPENIRYG